MTMDLKIKVLKYIKLLVLFLGLGFTALAQPNQGKSIDKVVAVVGANLILKSEIENDFQQRVAQGEATDGDTRCEILEQLLFQKLLINQAEVDSVEVTEQQVEGELDQRIRYFIAQVGSEKKLEDYYGKSIIQIKADFKDEIRKLLLAKAMQAKITANVKVTPSEVRTFFNSIPQDSLPLLNAEVEVAQIVRNPPISPDEKRYIKEKVEKLRERILAGEDFATLAILYSEDPGSAKNGGELGFVSRTDLVPEFAGEAFNLKGKDVSPVVESAFGYHIIQLIERRGEQVNVRHILLAPKIASSDIRKAQLFLDSVKQVMVKDSIPFSIAAAKFSDDAESKYNSGLMVNPQTGTTRFEMSELGTEIFYAIENLKIGEMSNPIKTQTTDGKQSYRLVMLKSKTQPHRANLKDDYQRIQGIALQQKQQKLTNEWVNKKASSTHIKIDEDYQKCNFTFKWISEDKASK